MIPGIFDKTAEPEIWTNGPDDEIGSRQWFSFGFKCGDLLCLIPLMDEVDETRKGLWLAPICNSEETAKRIFFLVNSLLNELDEK